MTPEQAARAEFEAEPALVDRNGWAKYHRHPFSNDIHRDVDCYTVTMPHRRRLRRRVYVFDADTLDEHERIISQRVYTEGWKAGFSRAMRHMSDEPNLDTTMTNPYQDT